MTKLPNERTEPLELDNLVLRDALDQLEVPSYVLDAAGVIRWTNAAAKAIFGDRTGESYLGSVADEDRDRAKERFARRIYSACEEVATRSRSQAAIIGPFGCRFTRHRCASTAGAS